MYTKLKQGTLFTRSAEQGQHFIFEFYNLSNIKTVDSTLCTRRSLFFNFDWNNSRKFYLAGNSYPLVNFASPVLQPIQNYIICYFNAKDWVRQDTQARITKIGISSDAMHSETGTAQDDTNRKNIDGLNIIYIEIFPIFCPGLQGSFRTKTCILYSLKVSKPIYGQCDMYQVYKQV